jgi:hypothetical protein
MKAIVSWRGGQEENPKSSQILIELLTKPRSIIDIYASIFDFFKYYHVFQNLYIYVDCSCNYSCLLV